MQRRHLTKPTHRSKSHASAFVRNTKILAVACIGLGALLGYAAASGRLHPAPVGRRSTRPDPLCPLRRQPIGPATKHMAEEVKRGPWNDLRVRKGEVIHDTNEANVWLRQDQVDFPMSSLASGLQVAERQILKKALVPLEGTTGVYKVLVEGWEFMIDTTKTPWLVYHAVIK